MAAERGRLGCSPRGRWVLDKAKVKAKGQSFPQTLMAKFCPHQNFASISLIDMLRGVVVVKLTYLESVLIFRSRKSIPAGPIALVLSKGEETDSWGS